MDLDSNYQTWNIYVNSFANLDFSNVSINQIDGISTYNGFIHFIDVDYVNPTDAMVFQNFGSFVGERVHFSGGDAGVEILAIDNSTINLRNCNIDNGLGGNNYILQGYKGSKLNLSNTKITTKSAVPIIMVGGRLDMDGMSIDGGDDNGIELYSDSSSGIPVSTKATISNSIVSHFIGDGIFAISPNIKITNSKIINNGGGFEFYVQRDADLSVTNSTVVGNVTGISFGIQNESANINLDVRRNFWGDKTGPFVVGINDDGLGDEIVGYSDFAKNKIQFDPWLAKEPNKRNPVIIIPGIMGSYLNKDDADKTEVWPRVKTIIGLPFDSLILDSLLLPLSGRPDTNNNIFSNGVIRNIYSSDFFDGLVNKLNSEEYKEGEDLFVFPYDWRLDLVDNVNGAENSKVESLKHKIDQILKDTKSDKVDMIAHSMGGLLAKYYIKHIGGNNVDKFIDIGTPHLGAPKAEKVLMYGDDMGMKINNFFSINMDEIKKISQNFPSTYNLLPSKKYFDSSLVDYMYYVYDLGDADGDGITGRLSYADTKSFLKNSGRNDLLIQNAESVHNDLDNFNPSDYGVKSFNIVGCGTPTIGKIFANNEQYDGDYKYQIKYITGDGTVPERSAEGMNTDQLFYVTGVEHATMPSQGGIRDLVASILDEDIDNFDYSSNPNIKTNTDNCALPDGKIISIHSPVSLDIYDDVGHHTGPDENGDIEYGIDGVVYDTLDGNKFAFIPNTVNYKIRFNATGVGTAGVDVQDYRNGAIVKSESFSDIPIVSLNTKGEVVVSTAGSQILLDRNGDDVIETLHPDLSVDGDLPESVTSVNIVDNPISSISTVTSGIQIATTSLNIQTLNSCEYPGGCEYLSNKISKSIPVLEKSNKTEVRHVDEVSSATPPKEVELKDDSTWLLASPVGFFNNYIGLIWNFLLELFNKIINLFK